MKRIWQPGDIVRTLILAIFFMLVGIEGQPTEVQRLLESAQSYSDSGAPGQAASAMAQAAEQVPWRSDLWESAGVYALQAGDPQSALLYFQRASEDDLSPTGYIVWGDAAEQTGDMVGAIHHWEAATQRAVSSEEALVRLFKAHRQLGDYIAAADDLKTLIALQPSDPRWNYQLGLLLAAREPESALAYLELAAETDPELSAPVQAIADGIRSARRVDDPAFALVSAGRALASIGEWELAAAAFSRATKLRPDYAEAWAFFGEARQHTGGDGLPALTKAIQFDPTSFAANIFLALYWQRQEEYDQALVYLSNAADNAPKNPSLQIEIGNTLAILGKLDDAYKHYQRAVDLAPNDPANWRHLAAFSINYDYRLQEVALPVARQAVLIDPKDPASQDILGQTYARMEIPLLAERFFWRALEVDSGYAPAHLHLGALYLLQGDRSRAAYHLSKASALSLQDAPAAAEASRLLQRYFP